MAKGGKRVKKEKKTVAIDVGSDDHLYDEQDQFHNEDRKIGKGKIRQVHGKKVEEVLNVEGDDSEEEEEDDMNSDFGSDAGEVDPDDEANLPSKEQWGRKRKDFYKSGYVDNDYGGVGSSDEEELAHLEELDAVSRQKQLDASTAAAAVEDDVWIEEDEEKESETARKKAAAKLTVEKEWSIQLAREKNEEMEEWIGEYNRTRNVCDSVVDELTEITAMLPKESAVRKQLLLVADTYAAYLLNLTFYLSLKSASFKGKKTRDAAVDEHPVVEKLTKMKKLVRTMDEFIGKNMEQVMELRERLKGGEKSQEIVVDDIIVAKKSKKEMAMEEMEEGLEGMGMEDGEQEGKRGVGYHITKNIQLNKKRKKGPSHSRAQKKVQYHKALIKRRSQVPDVRREDARYSGEARGIRASTVKSTKLIA
ncbi:hypothetical protein PMAYCL1PPCAC_06524 [Pristionchus mayeri]|uniref:Sas10 C-terminal domain-containing protein n=1 Tax=Pristionchus mayeri TaxID=1317129 RepID=A0AAN4ZAZ0_9BILA|nr:hypothetical protein PMAYCL1PPCAC_06524 [Pristionchus mayeri]